MGMPLQHRRGDHAVEELQAAGQRAFPVHDTSVADAQLRPGDGHGLAAAAGERHGIGNEQQPVGADGPRQARQQHGVHVHAVAEQLDEGSHGQGRADRPRQPVTKGRHAAEQVGRGAHSGSVGGTGLRGAGVGVTQRRHDAGLRQGRDELGSARQLRCHRDDAHRGPGGGIGAEGGQQARGWQQGPRIVPGRASRGERRTLEMDAQEHRLVVAPVGCHAPDPGRHVQELREWGRHRRRHEGAHAVPSQAPRHAPQGGLIAVRGTAPGTMTVHVDVGRRDDEIVAHDPAAGLPPDGPRQCRCGVLLHRGDAAVRDLDDGGAQHSPGQQRGAHQPPEGARAKGWTRHRHGPSLCSGRLPGCPDRHGLPGLVTAARIDPR